MRCVGVRAFLYANSRRSSAAFSSVSIRPQRPQQNHCKHHPARYRARDKFRSMIEIPCLFVRGVFDSRTWLLPRTQNANDGSIVRVTKRKRHMRRSATVSRKGTSVTAAGIGRRSAIQSRPSPRHLREPFTAHSRSKARSSNPCEQRIAVRHWRPEDPFLCGEIRSAWPSTSRAATATERSLSSLFRVISWVCAFRRRIPAAPGQRSRHACNACP